MQEFSSTILDGTKIASLYHEKSRAIIQRYAHNVPNAKLATILVGNDPASATYVRMKHNACKKVGLEPLAIRIDNTASTDTVLNTIQELNNDPSVFGILLQHPIASHMDERLCFDSIALEKDVDGVTSSGYGKLSMGCDGIYGSCTPQGIMYLLNAYDVNLNGMNAVVVGRSPILGKPMGAMLLQANATVTMCHSRTKNLKEHVNNADLIVAAVGKKEFIQDHWIKDNAVIVDAGYHPGRVGDVMLSSDLVERCRAYTPVPGGVGPMTIAVLIYQTCKAIEKSIEK